MGHGYFAMNAWEDYTTAMGEVPAEAGTTVRVIGCAPICAE